MKAITVKQPWASLIVHGIKDIENRTWPCHKKYIGQRVLIHASGKSMSVTSVNSKLLFTSKQDWVLGEKTLLSTSDIVGFCYNTSVIVGSVEIVDCVQNHPSVWAEKGVYNWVLANPILFANPIPAKGKLSFWDYNGVIEEGGKP